MSNHKAKISVGCRLAPDLRDELLEEAEESGFTLSNYIESLLAHRQMGKYADPYLYDEIDELKAENEKIRTQLVDFQKVEGTSDTENEMDENAEVQKLLQKLNETYPDLMPDELLILALKTALLNSKNNFFIYSISDVLHSPNLTQKLLPTT